MVVLITIFLLSRKTQSDFVVVCEEGILEFGLCEPQHFCHMQNTLFKTQVKVHVW